MNEKAALFRSLHTPGNPLVLVNAWDAATARIAAAAGSPAVATTSAGVAWSLGAPDGDALDRGQAIAVIRRVVAAVPVPVTADIESGFGVTPADVAETVRLVVAAGAVGVNIEDGDRTVEEQAARIAAARAAAGDGLFINARLDAYLRGRGDLAETVARAATLVEAGADGVFVPGVTEPSTVAQLAERVAAPLNVLTGPGAPTVGELAKLGVARVSLGSSVAQTAYDLFRRVTTEALSQGTYAKELAEAYDFGELNDLMRYSA
ncbi:isocitrate lyase/phosphoenolpyruvate mutase family protein [Actinoplanes sp. NPDC048796]|uniref:isocitrate lyase/PEP mutase family protein n=1 Tax=unclassified Actinoplanes TaxID=2626549 RepID=UPI0033CE3D65